MYCRSDHLLGMLCDKVTLNCSIVRQHKRSLHKKGTYKRQNKLSPQNNIYLKRMFKQFQGMWDIQPHHLFKDFLLHSHLKNWGPAMHCMPWQHSIYSPIFFSFTIWFMLLKKTLLWEFSNIHKNKLVFNKCSFIYF